MANAPQPPPRPTLDDLMRFKRAERPAPEFWVEFDRGLRQKQLAALVKRPKGWARIRPVFVRGLRWAVPATAAAAVATVVVQMPLGLATREQPVEVASRNVDSAVDAVDAQSLRADPGPSQARSVVVAQSRPVETTVPADSSTTAEPASRHLETEPQDFAWSAVALSGASAADYGAANSFTLRPASREARRPRSSWTSRFNQLVHELGAEVAPEFALQFASLDLSGADSADTAVLAAATPGRFVTGASGLGRETDERLLRELDRRFGVTGSSLSIKF